MSEASNYKGKAPQAVLDETKKHRGVDLHYGSLRISFSYLGVQNRETMKGMRVSVGNVKFCANKRAVILHEISMGIFDYRSHFPDSKRASLYSAPEVKKNRTVREAVNAWLLVKEVRLAPSGYESYRKRAKKVTDYWGDRLLSDITKSDIEEYQATLIKAGYAPKYVNDIFTVVRGIFGDGFVDEITLQDPTTRITNYQLSKEASNCFPFTIGEMNRIESTPSKFPQEINMVLFDCWVGLSISELIALAWEDIDLERWTARIRRAHVNKAYKVPKETYRERTVEIIHPARKYLINQKSLTFNLPGIEIKVRQRDNITFSHDRIRPVFCSSRTGKPHDSVRAVTDGFLRGHLRNASVPHRGANQCKHTFASRMLTNFVPRDWIIRQTGHKNEEMLYRHYAKFMTDEQPLMSTFVSGLLGFDTDKIEADIARGNPEVIHMVGK